MSLVDYHPCKYLWVSIKVEFRRITVGELMAKIENLLLICEAHQFTKSGPGEIRKYFSLGMEFFSANIKNNPAMCHFVLSLDCSVLQKLIHNKNTSKLSILGLSL